MSNTLMDTENMSINGEPRSLLKRWFPATVLMICVVLAFFDKISIAVLFADPAFREAMAIGDDKAKLGWLMTSFLLAYGFSSVFLSVIGDYINPKKVLFWMVLSWGVIMLIMGFTTTFTGMLINRILLGLAEGPLFAICYSIVKQSYSDKQQARASTMFLLGTPIGASLGFPITAYVLNNYDWHTTFFVMSALTIVVLSLIYFGLRNIELSVGRRQKTNHKANFKILMQSIPFWLTCAFNIALMAYLWGLNSWIPTYLIEEKQFNMKSFGSLSMIPFLAMLVGEIFGAYYSDKFGKYRARQVFLGLFLAGIFMFLVERSNTIFTIMLFLSLSSMTWGICASAIFALLARVSEKEVATTAGGIFNGLSNFSSAIVPVAIGYIVATTQNFNHGIIFLSLIAVLGSLVLLPLLNKH